MPLTIAQLGSEAMRLPSAGRAELAEQLVESLEFSENDGVQQAWAAEALRRRDEVRAGQVKTIPGEQVFEEVRRMLDR
ncbi:MAG: addiction module component CHP02574 family protein [Pedosphaera sp.]|nr:addiction module component CHP02574 family protein [Pedosphaera sp.]